ncbi:MAG: TspO/MBR family protein [Patescibacteria group bacterium]
MKPTCIAIPLIAFSLAALASAFASHGLPGVDVDVSWYDTLNLPSFTPPNWVFGVVWPAIVILATTSLILVWNNPELRTERGTFGFLIALFALNGLLYVSWTPIFFVLHLLDLAVWVAGFLAADVWSLTFLTWRFSRIAAALLLPYALWATFATYLAYSVAALN